MIVERSTDAGFINRVANHPDVRPFLHWPQDRDVDLTPYVQNPNNLLLQGEFGGMLIIQHLAGLYELHTQIIPEGRGAWALKMAHDCVEYLFTRTNAVEVFTRVPQGNVAALALTKACGARMEQRVLQNFGGEMVQLDIYGGRIQDWIKVAPGLEEMGREFHARLHTKAYQAGLNIDHHESDDWHDRHVGAAAAMILGGQWIKGVSVFNRWAAMAMAPPIKVISVEPLVLDITDCAIMVQGNDFEVMKPCQSEP